MEAPLNKPLPDGFPPAEKSFSLYEGIDYRRFWNDTQLGRQDTLEKYIISEMLPVSGRRILDLGGGYGRLAPCYVDRFTESVLCDGSLSLLREARDTLGGRVVLVAADVARLPFREAAFDSVLTIRVLQHVHDLERVVVEMRRVMGTGGHLVFSYHNKRNAKRIATHFMARGDANPFSAGAIEPFPTLISRHPKVVDALIDRAEFSPPEYQGTALVHPLESLGLRLQHHPPAGARWAPVLGRLRLAPWLIGKSIALGGSALESGTIGEIFQCPVCRGDLRGTEESFECLACHRAYPVENGIYDFRTEGRLP
jgi:SAM-dependent methyltransferase